MYLTYVNEIVTTFQYSFTISTSICNFRRPSIEKNGTNTWIFLYKNFVTDTDNIHMSTHPSLCDLVNQNIWLTEKKKNISGTHSTSFYMRCSLILSQTKQMIYQNEVSGWKNIHVTHKNTAINVAVMLRMFSGPVLQLLNFSFSTKRKNESPNI